MRRVKFNYAPLPAFEAFHRTFAREKCSFGSVGSGKTISLCADGIGHMLDWPGSLGMISRRTVPDLRDTTEAEFLGLLGTPDAGIEDITDGKAATLLDLCTVRRSGGHVSYIEFPTKSVMLFRSIDIWTRILGYNLSWVGLDEANEFDERIYVSLLGRLRRTEPLAAAQRAGYTWPKDKRLIKQQIALACNSHGHNWIWDRFVNNPGPDTRYFVTSSFDNPYLFNLDGSPGPYLLSLLRQNPVFVRRFVFTEFDAFTGQIFSEFNDAWHVHQAFNPPADWERVMGMDWGLRNAVALVWLARAPGSRKWHVYREWSSHNYFSTVDKASAVTPTIESVATVIRSLEKGEHIRWRAADPSIWRRNTGDKKNINTAETFQTKYKLHFRPGAAKHENRIMAVNELLHHQNLSVSTECPMTRVSVQQYRWEDVDVKGGEDTRDQPERPLKKDDHHVDALAYACTIINQPLQPEGPRHYPGKHDEVWRKVREQVAKQAARSVR